VELLDPDSNRELNWGVAELGKMSKLLKLWSCGVVEIVTAIPHFSRAKIISRTIEVHYKNKPKLVKFAKKYWF